MPEKHLLFKALKGEELVRPPVWMMRQAGRFLPSYRNIRSQYKFLEMCRTPEVAAKVSLLPVDELGVDAAIIFSDILVPFPPMGFELTIDEGVGPRIHNTLDCSEDLLKIREFDIKSELDYVYESIGILRQELHDDLDLIGFAGAPWTLATYLIEGKTGKNFAKTKKLMREDPETVHALLEKLSSIVAQHLNFQIMAGANVVQLFDSWAGALSPQDFKIFALPYASKVFQILNDITEKSFGSIYFPNGASESYGSISKAENLNVDAVSVDWRIPLTRARKRIDPNFAIQGNFDPTFLYGSKDKISSEVSSTLDSIRMENGKFKGYIANLGHGILPDIPVDGAKAFIDAVQNC